MKVSIVIPAYNRASLIAETLDSILNQTYLDWECVVVDDNSTDNTSAIVKSYCCKDERIKYVLNRKSKGAQGARNTGFDLSTGEFLIFLDSDDLLGSICLEQRIAFATENPNLDFYCFPTALFRHKAGDTSLLWNYLNKKDDDIIRFLKQDMPWHTSGVLWKRNMIMKVGGWDEKLGIWQDWDIHFRALITENCLYKKASNFAIDSYYRIEPDQNAISSKWISAASKSSYIYLIHKLIEFGFSKEKQYNFELVKLSYRISRLIYEKMDDKDGLLLFRFSQQQLGYSSVFSNLWILHMMLSKSGNHKIARKLGNIIPKFFGKSKLTGNKRTHLIANIPALPTLENQKNSL